MTQRIDWQARRAEVAALVEANATLEDIGEALGCTENTASAGLRRLGLRLDPAVVRARSAAQLRAVATDPQITERRRATLKERLAGKSEKMARRQRARAQWQNPEVRARNTAAVIAATEAMGPEARAARSAKAAATRMAWLPAHRADDYARLRRMHGATAARAMIEAELKAERVQLRAARADRPSVCPAAATLRLVERIAQLSSRHVAPQPAADSSSATK